MAESAVAVAVRLESIDRGGGRGFIPIEVELGKPPLDDPRVGADEDPSCLDVHRHAVNSRNGPCEPS